MVEKPTIPGYYRFRVGNDWFIDIFRGRETIMRMNNGNENSLISFDKVDEIVGPIDPRPEAPATATPPDEVEALAEKIFVEIVGRDTSMTIQQVYCMAGWSMECAAAFRGLVKDRNARREEARK